MYITRNEYARARLENLMVMNAYQVAHMLGIPENEVDYRYAKADEAERFDDVPSAIEYLIDTNIETVLDKKEVDSISKDARSVFYDDLIKLQAALEKTERENRNAIFHVTNAVWAKDWTGKDVTYEELKELAKEERTSIYLVFAMHAFRKDNVEA